MGDASTSDPTWFFPGDAFVADLSLTNNVVDNSEYAYHIQYNPEDGCDSSSCRLFKCFVRYEIDEPLP